MADLAFRIVDGGMWPADPMAAEWMQARKRNDTIRAKVSVMRNGRFHRKFFAMLNVAYDNYDWPDIETQFGSARCTFEQFREYVTIKAGHFVIGATPKGKPRAEAKSISWAKMDEAEFGQLYSEVLDVILQEFLSNWTAADMEQAVNKMMTFA